MLWQLTGSVAKVTLTLSRLIRLIDRLLSTICGLVGRLTWLWQSTTQLRMVLHRPHHRSILWVKIINTKPPLLKLAQSWSHMISQGNSQLLDSEVSQGIWVQMLPLIASQSMATEWTQEFWEFRAFWRLTELPYLWSVFQVRPTLRRFLQPSTSTLVKMHNWCSTKSCCWSLTALSVTCNRRSNRSFTLLHYRPVSLSSELVTQISLTWNSSMAMTACLETKEVTQHSVILCSLSGSLIAQETAIWRRRF